MYKEPCHITLVANKRKEEARESRKVGKGSGNIETGGHPDVLSMVKDCAWWKQVLVLTKKKPQGNA